LNIRRHCVEDLQHEIVSLNYGQKITGCPLNKPVLNLQRNKVHRRFSSAAENNLRQRRPVIRTVRYVERDNYKKWRALSFCRVLSLQNEGHKKMTIHKIEQLTFCWLI